MSADGLDAKYKKNEIDCRQLGLQEVIALTCWTEGLLAIFKTQGSGQYPEFGGGVAL